MSSRNLISKFSGDNLVIRGRGEKNIGLLALASTTPIRDPHNKKLKLFTCDIDIDQDNNEVERNIVSKSEKIIEGTEMEEIR
jgi:hypothetical protein